MPTDTEKFESARELWLEGATTTKISMSLDVPCLRTVQRWIVRFHEEAARDDYPLISLRRQLSICTDKINALMEKVANINILRSMTKLQAQHIANFKYFSRQQLVLIDKIEKIRITTPKPPLKTEESGSENLFS